jgi:hypothetical protein
MLNDAAAYGKTQARAHGISRIAGARLMKLLEYVLLLMQGNAGAVVGDADG